MPPDPMRVSIGRGVNAGSHRAIPARIPGQHNGRGIPAAQPAHRVSATFRALGASPPYGGPRAHTVREWRFLGGEP